VTNDNKHYKLQSVYCVMCRTCKQYYNSPPDASHRLHNGDQSINQSTNQTVGQF